MAELYQITGPGGLRYIGVTAQTAAERLRVHLQDAKAGKGPRNRFYRAIRAHNSEAFTARTLVVGSWDYVLEIEDAAINALETMSPLGYNTTRGGRAGGRQSAEVRAAMAEAARARHAQPGGREKLSELQRTVWARPGHRERMVARHEGHTVTAETRAKMAATSRSRQADPEVRAAHSERMKLWWAARKELLK